MDSKWEATMGSQLYALWATNPRMAYRPSGDWPMTTLRVYLVFLVIIISQHGLPDRGTAIWNRPDCVCLCKSMLRQNQAVTSAKVDHSTN
jgi:hypothetical protein